MWYSDALWLVYGWFCIISPCPTHCAKQVEVLSALQVRPEYLVRRWRPVEKNMEPTVAASAPMSLPLHFTQKDEVNRRAKEQLEGQCWFVISVYDFFWFVSSPYPFFWWTASNFSIEYFNLTRKKRVWRNCGEIAKFCGKSCDDATCNLQLAVTARGGLALCKRWSGCAAGGCTEVQHQLMSVGSWLP